MNFFLFKIEVQNNHQGDIEKKGKCIFKKIILHTQDGKCVSTVKLILFI